MTREQRLLAIVAELLADHADATPESGLASLVGSAVVVRTVTYHYLGRLTAIEPDTLVLADASWLADSGRWAQMLADGSPSEVEPYPDPVRVSRGAVVDITLYRHPLPREAA